jgi:diacylglycerol kinase (ATP)
LTLTFLKKAGKLKFLRLFPRVYKGTHIEHELVDQYHGKKIRLEAPDQIVYADGERIGPLPADIEVVPDAVRVLVPKDHTWN